MAGICGNRVRGMTKIPAVSDLGYRMSLPFTLNTREGKAWDGSVLVYNVKRLHILSVKCDEFVCREYFKCKGESITIYTLERPVMGKRWRADNGQ